MTSELFDTTQFDTMNDNVFAPPKLTASDYRDMYLSQDENDEETPYEEYEEEEDEEEEEEEIEIIICKRKVSFKEPKAHGGFAYEEPMKDLGIPYEPVFLRKPVGFREALPLRELSSEEAKPHLFKK